MSVQWTKEQQKVIETRNRNLLVSAAAGSGKTAVLVERIIQMILDKDQPIDIDRLLVVTFTNAAASEMRERIGEAIERQLINNPDHTNLHRQLALLQHASITTIHSFCLSILRHYFHMIDLDPSFRIADETELTLLKSDVLKEVLEAQYESKDEDFYALIESYSSNKSDDQLEALVLKLYTFSQSYPWPNEWLYSQEKSFEIGSREAFLEMPWVKGIEEYVNYFCKDLYEQMQYIFRICQREDGPCMYLETIAEELEQLEAILEETRYDKLYELFNALSFNALSRKKSDQVEPNLREEVKNIRTEVKKELETIREQFFFQSLDEMINDSNKVQPVIGSLIQLVVKFSEAYSLAKKEKNIVDFNDLEHLALKLLVEKDVESGEVIPTQIALELQEQYAEILVDEYQDSNLVQETLLMSVSKANKGQPNIFMVGDVKQSIYKFRLAKPELFMEKYDTYSTEESSYQRIDLHKNFRSRKEVIATVNFIFYQIMSKKVGDVQYNEETALYEGASFSTCEHGECGGSTEIHLIQGGQMPEEEEEGFDLTDRELEAKMIGKRIKQLMNQENPYMVYDKKLGRYRAVQLKDIVILLRTISGWAEVFAEVLMEEGIPSFCDTSSGYFDTIEVKTMLSVLSIIDNPRQDIPLLAVLRSPIVGFDDETLARIRSAYPNGDYYFALCSYLEEPIYHELTPRLEAFMNQLNKWRDKASVTSIHELMWEIYEETHYYDYVSVMPGGKQRQANLDMLIEKAMKFEQSSYKGLFNFIRFIERLRKYDVDMGEASILGENEDLVRIMSIHKSKGLEFPVVFVSGLGKKFNYQDLYQSVIIHPDLGLGPDYVEYELRYKKPTLAKKAIQKRLELESLSEELRVLYVALTRAKEKLILTGTVSSRSSIEKKLEKWARVSHHDPVELPYSIITGANNYLDWIIPSVMRHKDSKKLIEKVSKSHNFNHALYDSDVGFHINIFTLEDLLNQEIIEQLENEWLEHKLVEWDPEEIYDEKLREEVEKRLTWEYPFKGEVNVHVKMSVSDIKKHIFEEELEVPDLIHFEVEETKPKFIEEQSKLTAAEKGTLMHKVMQYVSLESLSDYNRLTEELIRLELHGFISEKERNALYIKDLFAFSKTTLYKRMLAAEKIGNLFKEKQFVLGVRACDLDEELKSDEVVLIQGVIDCFIIEEDGLVLMDYKTDYVPEGNEKILIERYEKQLRYYQQALEQITGNKVKERIIYSFGLSKEINC